MLAPIVIRAASLEVRRIRRIPARTREVFAPRCEHATKSGACRRVSTYQVAFAARRPDAPLFVFYVCSAHRAPFSLELAKRCESEGLS